MTDTALQFIEEESRPGHFNVIVSESGERYVIIDGLHAGSIKETIGLEHFMQTHYDFFAMLYALLIVATLVYLIGSYIIIPLMQAYQRKNR